MAGPAQTSPLRFIVPPGEAQVLYSSRTLAQKIQNFELTQDGTLKSVVGPAVYEPVRKEGSGILLSDMRGIFHAALMGGIADTLLVRSGSVLYRHAGWERGWEPLYTGLSDEHRPIYPDQFLVLNNTIIYTNGIDRALTINHDGMVTPLGFSNVPATPFAGLNKCPQTPEAKACLTPTGIVGLVLLELLGMFWTGKQAPFCLAVGTTTFSGKMFSETCLRRLP